MLFKDYFGAVDAQDVIHTGFLQSMNLSSIAVDITMINELTTALMDAYLYNLYSHSFVLRNWQRYLTYNKDEHRLEINTAFYSDFVSALYGYLARSEKWYQLTQTNFRSISVEEVEEIEHGKKETERDYGSTETERAYGQDETEHAYGQDSTQHAYGAGSKSTARGAQTVTRDYDRVVVTVEKAQDTHTVGAAHTEGTSTNTGKVYPLGAAAYVDDTQQVQLSEQDTDAQTNTDTYGDQETTTAARQDAESHGSYTDTETTTAKTDTDTRAARTDTDTRAARTDTETTAARKDTETVKTYIDTKTRTKYVIIAPDKYFQIEKELADIGVYDLMAEAVKDTMLLCAWEV